MQTEDGEAQTEDGEAGAKQETGELFAKNVDDLQREANTNAAYHDRRKASLWKWHHLVAPVGGVAGVLVTGGGAVLEGWVGALVGLGAAAVVAIVSRLELKRRARNAEARAAAFRHVARGAGVLRVQLAQLSRSEADTRISTLQQRFADADSAVP